MKIIGVRNGRRMKMIKGFLLAFDIILILLFLVFGVIQAFREEEIPMGTVCGAIGIIIAMNALYIVNS